MRSIHWHIARTLLLATLLVMTAMLALVAIFALMDELRDAKAAYSFMDGLWYTTLTLPRRGLEILPYAIFLGSLIGLGSLAEHSELTVLRAAGLSPAQLFKGVALSALFLMSLGLVAGEWLAPVGEQQAELFKSQQEQDSDDVALVGGYWYREGNLFVNIDGLDDSGALTGVRQFLYDDSKALIRSRRAESARWRADSESWLLEGVVSSSLPTVAPISDLTNFPAIDALGKLRVVTQAEPQVDWLSQANPRLLSTRLLVDANRLSIADLYYQIDYMRREKLAVTSYELAFWTRVQQPLAVLGLALLAMAFVLGPLRQVSIGLRVSAGVLVGLTFKYLQDLFTPMSLVYGLAPILAVALPIAICWVVAVIALRRIG